MTTKVRRTKSREWNGNGFGYHPAEYAVHVNGRERIRLTYGMLGWQLTDEHGTKIGKWVYGSFKEARAHALEIAGDA